MVEDLLDSEGRVRKGVAKIQYSELGTHRGEIAMEEADCTRSSDISGELRCALAKAGRCKLIECRDAR